MKKNAMKVKDLIKELLQFNQEAELEFVISTFDGNTEVEDFFLNPYDEKTMKNCEDIDATHIEFGLELHHKFTITQGEK